MRVCFFSNEPPEQLQKEQYSIQDITILTELGFQVTIATSFNEIPLGCDLYFSWWASGSILPLIKARLSKRPILVVAGGNEAMFYRDSITGIPLGYLAAPWYKQWATRYCLRHADRVLIVSEFMKNDVMKLGAKAPIVVHNSINLERFAISSLPRTYVTSIFNLDEDVIKIKRGETFIHSIPEVVQTFPGQKFLIVGEKSNAFERLKKLTIDLGIENNVEFIGSIPNSEVIRWMQSSRVYVQISDTETFGVAIAEAMSCGTPVVVSRRGAIPELVGDCGTYVDHNDPYSVAEGIIQLLSNSEETNRKIGLEARRRVVEHFSFSNRKAHIQHIILGMDI